MNKQNRLKHTLSQPDSIEHIQNRLEQVGNVNRTRLAAELCEHFNFFDPKGNTQLAGCLKALRELEKAGCFILPASRATNSGQEKTQRRLNEPVALPLPLPEDAGKIQQLHLILVETPQQMRLWNELMIQDHPQGKRPLVGRQLRYLIQSEQGW